MNWKTKTQSVLSLSECCPLIYPPLITWCIDIKEVFSIHFRTTSAWIRSRPPSERSSDARIHTWCTAAAKFAHESNDGPVDAKHRPFECHPSEQYVIESKHAKCEHDPSWLLHATVDQLKLPEWICHGRKSASTASTPASSAPAATASAPAIDGNGTSS